jgi:serine/threonine protein kinase
MSRWLLLLLLISSQITPLAIYSKEDQFKGRELPEEDARLGLQMEPPRKHVVAASLDELRPPMCLDESLDLQFGDHYNLVHIKSREMKSRCKFQDFEFSKKRLGSGGYGVVSKAVHKPTGKTFAIKSIIEMNPKWHPWIRAEECIQYGLDFPFITKFHCAMLHDWYAWLVLELVEGDTLQSILQKEKLARQTIQMMAAQLVLTIEYLHLNKVVFGDLTTANLMVGRASGDIKLIDFGFAKRMRSGLVEAPVWSDEGQVLPDFAENYFNDWYGFGIVLLQMLVSSREEGGTESEYRNKEFIDSTKLIRVNCTALLDDQVACDLVDSFLGYRKEGEWADVLGLRPGSAQLIRQHAFFRGFDWTPLEERVRPKTIPDKYNL